MFFKIFFDLKNIKLMFYLVVYDVLMLKIKKIKTFIFMYFQTKNYFLKNTLHRNLKHSLKASLDDCATSSNYQPKFF